MMKMTRNNIMWTAAALLLGIAATVSSCSDDHFDINGEVSGRQSVWENIASQSELSEFADILSSLYYSKSEGNPTAQTYADLFSGDQTFTVWAPKNGTFDYATWKALLNDGTAASAWKVETELVRNCMARYTHLVSGSGVDKFDLFSNKSATMDCAAYTINALTMTQVNLGSNNGVVHITDGNIAYLPNLYEFLGTRSDLDSIADFIYSFEEEMFDESASTQGPTIDGNITWVDSVTTLYNAYLRSRYLDARIDREDSLYAMVIPTNKAWAAAYERVKPYFNYQQEYQQTITTVSADGTESSETKVTTMTDEELDSITKFRIHDVIARNLVFNTTEQYGHTVDQYSVEGACDSLLSTYGTTFYDPNSARLFAGTQYETLSNGYAFVVDEWNYKPLDAWVFEREFEAERVWETYSNCTPTTQKLSINYSYELNGETVDTIIEETVLVLTPTRSTGNTSATFQLPNTLSCKYDIYAVMAWNTDAARPYQFRAYLNYHQNGKTARRQQLSPIEGVNGTGRYFQTKAPHVDDNGILQWNDSVLVAQDFEFPFCYYGLEDAYVTLEIGSYMTSSQRTTYTNELMIDKIVLVPKVDEE